MPKLNQVYTGEYAERYDSARVSKPKWQSEQEVIVSLLRDIIAGERVVDLAAGTGRWLEVYKSAGAQVTLIDVSSDMLAQARLKAEKLGLPIITREADIVGIHNLPATDCVVCTRFFNWIRLDQVEAILRRAAGSGARFAVFTVRFIEKDASLAERVRINLGQWIKNAASRLGLSSTSKFFLHREADVLDVISRAEFRVGECQTIEAWKRSPLRCVSRVFTGNNVVGDGMLIEIYGLPGSGKTTAAGALEKDLNIENIVIKSRAELLILNARFFFRYPVRLAGLALFTLFNAGGPRLFYRKCLILIRANAKRMKAEAGGSGIIDLGHFQMLISTFEQVPSRKRLLQFMRLLPRPDLLLVFEVCEDIRKERLVQRGWQPRTEFGPEYTEQWMAVIEELHKSMMNLIADAGIPFLVVDVVPPREELQRALVTLR